MSETAHRIRLDTPLGPVRLRWRAGRLVAVDLDGDPEPPPGSEGPDAESQAVILDWFSAYFRDPAGGHADPAFLARLPLAPAATEFQRRLRIALWSIPPGRTLAYGELARRLGSAPRAVGQACRRNPCPILVPCHRVVAADGLGGFSGATAGAHLALKRWLLAHEGWSGVSADGGAVEPAGSPPVPRGRSGPSRTLAP